MKEWKVTFVHTHEASKYYKYSCLDFVKDKIEETDFSEIVKAVIYKRKKGIVFEEVITSNDKAEVLNFLKQF